MGSLHFPNWVEMNWRDGAGSLHGPQASSAMGQLADGGAPLRRGTEGKRGRKGGTAVGSRIAGGALVANRSGDAPQGRSGEDCAGAGDCARKPQCPSNGFATGWPWDAGKQCVGGFVNTKDQNVEMQGTPLSVVVGGPVVAILVLQGGADWIWLLQQSLLAHP